MTDMLNQGIHQDWFAGDTPVRGYTSVITREEGVIIDDIEVSEAERIIACVNFCKAFPTPLLKEMVSLQRTQQDNALLAESLQNQQQTTLTQALEALRETDKLLTDVCVSLALMHGITQLAPDVQARIAANRALLQAASAEPDAAGSEGKRWT